MGDSYQAHALLYKDMDNLIARTNPPPNPYYTQVPRINWTPPDYEGFMLKLLGTWFETIEEMQAVLDAYLVGYNTKRPHQGRGMNGRTPAKAFRDGIPRNGKKEDKADLKTAA